MSGAATSQTPQTTKSTTDDAAHAPAHPPASATKAPLEEDDEFEDFPVDDWEDGEAEGAPGEEGGAHLWEESWDDDDTNDDFAAVLREELQKVDSKK